MIIIISIQHPTASVWWAHKLPLTFPSWSNTAMLEQEPYTAPPHCSFLLQLSCGLRFSTKLPVEECLYIAGSCLHSLPSQQHFYISGGQGRTQAFLRLNACSCSGSSAHSRVELFCLYSSEVFCQNSQKAI